MVFLKHQVSGESDHGKKIRLPFKHTGAQKATKLQGDARQDFEDGFNEREGGTIV